MLLMNVIVIMMINDDHAEASSTTPYALGRWGPLSAGTRAGALAFAEAPWPSSAPPRERSPRLLEDTFSLKPIYCIGAPNTNGS